MPNLERVRDIRERLGLSAQELADRSGLSRSLIGMIESGRANPSLVTLAKLAEALGLAPYALLKELDSPDTPEPAAAPKGRVVRWGDRKLLTTAAGPGRVTHLLSPDLQGKLQVTLMDDAPHFSPSFDRITHEGEECGHVLAGAFEVLVGDERYILEEGDSITLDPTVPHIAREVGDKPGRMIWSCTPPWF